jgi:hypothetical protein
MLRSRHRGSFLVVEGSTDYRVFSKFINESSCRLHPAWSRQSVVQCIEVLDEDQFHGVVGVVDRDFDNLLGGGPRTGSPNLFFTDLHDMEVDMIFSNAFESVMTELTDRDLVRAFVEGVGESVRARLVSTAARIGALRLASLRAELGINFRSLDFSRFIDRDSLTLRENAFIADAARTQSLPLSTLREAYLEESQRTHDVRQVSCGHDILRIWAIGVKSSLAASPPARLDEFALASMLRTAYTTEEFSRTKLYSSLKDWEGRNSPFTIFA